MRIEVENIKVAARIRKLTARIDELAQDIQRNGLINPITVMAVEGGYQLLAGLRRLRAAQSLGWTEIEATVAAPKDAEAALLIEHSENVQREQFTFSEKMDYARLMEEIEKAKANERMLAGKEVPNPVDERPQGCGKGKSRDIIGEKIDMSGRQYDRAKYVADHGPQSVIDEIDNGKRTVNSAYEELRGADKRGAHADASKHLQHTVAARKNEPSSSSVAHPKQIPAVSTPTVKESDLQRAIRAESELDAFKYRQHNEIFHRDSIIESQKRHIAELEDALTAAHARIKELEDIIQCKS